jgi:hypothetical protein
MLPGTKAHDRPPAYRVFGGAGAAMTVLLRGAVSGGGTSLFRIDAVSSSHVIDTTQDLWRGRFRFSGHRRATPVDQARAREVDEMPLPPDDGLEHQPAALAALSGSPFHP